LLVKLPVHIPVATLAGNALGGDDEPVEHAHVGLKPDLAMSAPSAVLHMEPPFIVYELTVRGSQAFLSSPSVRAG
jgi:hypothetical protein